MADVVAVEVAEGVEELKEGPLELGLGHPVPQVGLWTELHHNVADPLLRVDINGFIFNDGFVCEPFDVHKVGLKEQEVLVLHLECLHSVELALMLL